MTLIFDRMTLINLYIINYSEATGATFIHKKSVKNVKTACVCIVFFFIILNIMVKTSFKEQ